MATHDPWKNLSRLVEEFSYSSAEEVRNVPQIGARREDRPEMLLVGIRVSHEASMKVTLEWMKAPR